MVCATELPPRIAVMAQHSFVRVGGFKRESIETIFDLLAIDIHPRHIAADIYLTVV